MKQLTLISVLLLFAATGFTQPEETIRNTDEYTWFGIDYTNCYFITKMDFPDPYDLESKFGAWNGLVMVERDKYIKKTLKKKDISFYIDMVNELNEDIVGKDRLTNDQSLANHLEEDMIQGIVDAYDIPEDMSGMGLVFIAESYYKPDSQGFYFVTFFDIASKKVIKTERMSGKAGGFGLRNYWARTYHQVLTNVGKMYK